MCAPTTATAHLQEFASARRDGQASTAGRLSVRRCVWSSTMTRTVCGVYAVDVVSMFDSPRERPRSISLRGS